MARSLNKVMLIGNLTRDPEMRYTPQGAAVCTFGVATNRNWTTDTGEKKEDVEFHNIVAWNKLAEICSQLLKKGRKVYVEGRLSTRSWQGQDGSQKQRTEVVITDMVILDRKMDEPGDADISGVQSEPSIEDNQTPGVKPAKASKSESKASGPDDLQPGENEAVNDEDIPF